MTKRKMISEEMLDQMLDQKLDQMLDQKVDQMMDQKVDQMLDQKLDQRQQQILELSKTSTKSSTSQEIQEVKTESSTETMELTMEQRIEQKMQQTVEMALQPLQNRLEQILQPNHAAAGGFMKYLLDAIHSCRSIGAYCWVILCRMEDIGNFCGVLFFWIGLIGYFSVTFGPHLSNLPPIAKFPWLSSSLSHVHHQLRPYFPSFPQEPFITDAYNKRLENLEFFRLRTAKLKFGLVFKHLVFDKTLHEMMIGFALAMQKLGHEIQVLTFENGTMYHMWKDYRFIVNITSATINKVDWLNYSAVLIDSIEAANIMCWLKFHPFKSVPVILTVRDGQLATKNYSVGRYREVFRRANAVVFPNYSLIGAYAAVDNGNFFVIPKLPTDLGGRGSDISKSIEAYALILESIIAVPPGLPSNARDVPEFNPVNWKEFSRHIRHTMTGNFVKKAEIELDGEACKDEPKKEEKGKEKTPPRKMVGDSKEGKCTCCQEKCTCCLCG